MLWLALGLALTVPVVAAGPGDDRAKQLQKLLKQLTKDKDPDVRKDAAEELGQLGGAEIANALGAALKDPSPDVRASVAGALVHLKGEASAEVPQLKEALGDTEPFVRYNAVVALSNMHAASPAELAPVITPFLWYQKDDFKVDSRDILMRLGISHEEVRAGVSAALSQGDPGVRRGVVQALGKELQDNVDSVAWVKEVVSGVAKKEADAETRRAAEDFLKEIATLQSSPGYRACQLLTREEAGALLGESPDKHLQSNACYFVVSGKSSQLVLDIGDDRPSLDSSIKFLDFRRRQKVEAGFKIQDEPTLGKGAFLAQDAGSAYFMFPTRSCVFVAVLLDHNGVPQVLLDGLRRIAKKAASRL
jgi:hypothetical protein